MDRIDEGFGWPRIVGIWIIVGRDTRPKFGHRHIAVLIGLQDINWRILRLAIDSFGIHLHAISMTKVGHVLEITFFHQVADGLSKVEEKGLGMTAVDDRFVTESRQPWANVVSPTFLEFFGKTLRPCLRSSFPTIDKEIPEDSRIDLLCQLKDFLWIIGEMHVQSGRVHLVTFQASSLPRGRVIGLACGGIAEPKHRPLSLTKRPSQHAMDIDMSRHVNHLPRIYDFLVGENQHTDITIIIHLAGRERQCHFHQITLSFASIKFTRDLRLAESIILHRQFGRNPGATTLAPPVTVGCTHGHTQAVGLLHGIAQHAPPLRGAKAYFIRHVGIWHVAPNIQHRGLRDAHSLHGLKVTSDALASDVAIEPMPPGDDMGPWFWLLE